MALARRFRPRAVSAFYPVRDEPDTLGLLAALRGRGRGDRDSRHRANAASRWSSAAGGRASRRSPGRCAFPSRRPRRRRSTPTCCSCRYPAFDRRGHRIGYGAGHYDRTLARLRALKPIVAVGVAYGVAEVAAIPDGPHDEKLDFVLTDSELIEIEAG